MLRWGPGPPSRIAVRLERTYPLVVSDLVNKYQKLVEQHPSSELARFSLAKALFDAGDYGLAAEHFRIALDRKPDWMVAHILVGRCHLALGDRARAREAFERARQLAIAQDHEGPLSEMEEALRQLQSEPGRQDCA